MNNNSRSLIYLADLVHNYASKGPHTFPVNIGYIASYARKIYGDKIEIKLFKFPMDLINAVKRQKPDILGLANYTWNIDLNKKMAAWVKSFSTDTVIICGGPDYPVDDGGSLLYLAQRPQFDFYVLDQGEGGFVNLLKRYFDCNSISQMKSAPVLNCAFYDSGKNKVIASDTYQYIEELGKIPSPYLGGLMDEFFDTNLIPVIETNRGCPYSCIYCAWGKASRKKIILFPLERVKQEIEYIAGKIKNTSLCIIADANFGILERDREIALFLKQVQAKYSYPRHLYVTWAKSAPKKITKLVEIMKDMIGINNACASFQTTDLKVMANIQRINISLREFKEVQDRLNPQGISTSSELILGLPGETKATHLKGLRDLFDSGASAIVCYNLRMLNGAELNTERNKKRFGIRTKYRLIDGGFGRYDDILSIEGEEMVLETDTMSREDILYFRPIHFLIQFLWNYKYYAGLIYFLKAEGINPVDFIIAIIENKGSASGSVREIFTDFTRETYSEWFDAQGELYDYYSQPENFERISEGAFGKLNYKYTYRFLLECKDDFDGYLFKIAYDMAGKRGKSKAGIKEQLDELLKYTSNMTIDFSGGLKERLDEKTIEFKYDILKWKNQGYRKLLAQYNGNIKLRFFSGRGQIETLKELYNQFRSADINQTMRKMVEYMHEKDLFYKVDYA